MTSSGNMTFVTLLHGSEKSTTGDQLIAIFVTKKITSSTLNGFQSKAT
jgi:hypothetical protein